MHVILFVFVVVQDLLERQNHGMKYDRITPVWSIKLLDDYFALDSYIIYCPLYSPLYLLSSFTDMCSLQSLMIDCGFLLIIFFAYQYLQNLIVQSLQYDHLLAWIYFSLIITHYTSLPVCAPFHMHTHTHTHTRIHTLTHSMLFHCYSFERDTIR